MSRLEIEVKNGVPTLKSMVPGDDEVKSYITQAAEKRGIDPKVALEVWSREGRGAWQSNYSKNGQREPSHGPFQLLSGGPGTGYPTGLGNKFRDQTGLDPSDPKNWKATVDFALDEAKIGGWTPWYGAKAAGITGFEGIAGNPAAFTPGGGLTNMGSQLAGAIKPQLSPALPMPSLQLDRRFGTMPKPILPNLPSRPEIQSPEPTVTLPSDLTGQATATLDDLIRKFAAPRVGSYAQKASA